jgi:REP element-mobilizing transposase RayT
MPRPARPNVAGGLYHVIQRGNNRQRIFFEEADRRAFLDRLQRCLRECACRVHAYCLMSNHLHLLVETEQPNLSVFSQRLFGGYTKWANRTHRRVGHLFQGRFTSSMVEEDPYLLQLSRYIHLNPVKARLVRQPEDYPWSSLRAYLPKARGPSWVHTATTLAYFGGSRWRYLAFVREGLEGRGDGKDCKGEKARTLLAEPTPEAHGPDDRDSSSGTFTQRDGVPANTVEALLGDLARLTGVAVTQVQRKYTRQRHVAQAKAQAAGLLRQRTHLSLAAIGRHLGGISAQAVSHWLRAHSI